MPSQPRMINYSCCLYIFMMSGVAITICLEIFKLGLFLNRKSPRARLKFKLPLIRPCRLILPPAAQIRIFYWVFHGLCSKLRSLYLELLLGVLMEARALLSPAFAQYICYLVRRIARAVHPAIVSPQYSIAFLNCAFYLRIYRSYCLPSGVSII